MSKITYVITEDLVTREPQINWCGSLLHLYEYKPLHKSFIDTYSGRYPFSIPVIPVHFFVSKDRYLLRS